MGDVGTGDRARCLDGLRGRGERNSGATDLVRGGAAPFCVVHGGLLDPSARGAEVLGGSGVHPGGGVRVCRGRRTTGWRGGDGSGGVVRRRVTARCFWSSAGYRCRAGLLCGSHWMAGEIPRKHDCTLRGPGGRWRNARGGELTRLVAGNSTRWGTFRCDAAVVRGLRAFAGGAVPGS